MANPGPGLAPLLAGAAVAGIAAGLYQVWRTSRRPTEFGPNVLLFGIVLGLALAVPVAASHGIAILTFDRIMDENGAGFRGLAVALLSTAIYLVSVNRVDRTLRLAGPARTLHHISDKLALFAGSLAIAAAFAMAR